MHADVSMPRALAAFFPINYRKQNDDWRKAIKTWAKYKPRVHIYICIYIYVVVQLLTYLSDLVPRLWILNRNVSEGLRRSDATITQLIINLWPRVSLCSNMVYIMEKLWFTHKSIYRTPLGLRSGRPFLPITPLHCPCDCWSHWIKHPQAAHPATPRRWGAVICHSADNCEQQ